MIDIDGYLKLVDFGSAKVCPHRTYTICGTPEYLAPEVILNKGHGKASDWWTLGIFLYEISVGEVPFTDRDPTEVYQKIIKGKYKFKRNINKEAKSLIKHLIVVDLSKRFGNLKAQSQDIKQHKFFKDIDF